MKLATLKSVTKYKEVFLNEIGHLKQQQKQSVTDSNYLRTDMRKPPSRFKNNVGLLYIQFLTFLFLLFFSNEIT